MSLDWIHYGKSKNEYYISRGIMKVNSLRPKLVSINQKFQSTETANSLIDQLFLFAIFNLFHKPILAVNHIRLCQSLMVREKMATYQNFWTISFNDNSFFQIIIKREFFLNDYLPSLILGSCE